MKRIKGTCMGCNKEISYQSLENHLESCESICQSSTPSKFILIKVVAVDNPDYYLFLLAKTQTTLRELDIYLRKLWLECCGHLSEFRSNGISFQSELCEEDFDQEDVESMFYPLKDIIQTRESANYDYDFGSTTELKITNLGAFTAQPYKDKITLIARNNPPIMPEGTPDKYNSPRTGVCCYEGPLDSTKLDKSYKKADQLTKKYLKDIEAFLEPMDSDFSDWESDDLEGEYDLEEMNYELDQREYKRNVLKVIEPKDTLVECFGNLTKASLTDFRKKIGVVNGSKLNKADLIRALEVKSIEYFLDSLNYMSTKKLIVLKKLIDNGGFIDYEAITKDLAYEDDFYHLALEDFIFVGWDATNSGRLIAVMPQDLYKLVSTTDLDNYKLKAKRNDIWIKLTIGLCHAYGALILPELVEQIGHITKKQLEIADVEKVLNAAQNYYADFTNEGIFYFWFGVQDVIKVIKEQAKRQEVVYKTYSKEEILLFQEMEYYKKTKETNAFEYFLRDSYSFTSDMAEQFMSLFVHMFLEGDLMQNVLKEITQMIEIPDTQVLQEVTDMIVAIYNTSPQWFLKGNAPKDISGYKQEQKETVSPFAIQNLGQVSISAQKADIIDMKTKKKVERNDLCPCGSGKKYKQCCGK